MTLAQRAHISALEALLRYDLPSDLPEHGHGVTHVGGISIPVDEVHYYQPEPLDTCHVCDGRGMNCPECGGSGDAPVPTYPEEV
jgi:hypothetical protein